MALGLVDVQHLLDLKIQRAVELRQPLGDILMYRGFADSEFGSGGADRGPVFYDVKGKALGPLLHVYLQSTTIPASCWFIL